MCSKQSLSDGLPLEISDSGMNNAADDKESSPAVYLPHFNVDKFIEDLPQPVADPEKILRNLSMLRTPMADHNFGNTPGFRMTTDSPLFTPILMKENAWWTSPQSQFMQPKKAPMLGVEDGVGDGSESNLLFKDIQQIWSPAAF